MEALTTAFKLWTSIEKVQSDQWTGSLDFTLNSFRQTCKTTNSATESPRSKCSVCQGSRAPPSCEEAQEAEQRQQEMCCCQTLQREGAHCLCAWHWPQPSGFLYVRNISNIWSTTFFRSTMLCWSEVEDCRTCPMCQQSVSEENMTCPTWSRRASLHPNQKQHLQSHDCESDILQVHNMFKIFYNSLSQPGEKATWKS